MIKLNRTLTKRSLLIKSNCVFYLGIEFSFLFFGTLLTKLYSPFCIISDQAEYNFKRKFKLIQWITWSRTGAGGRVNHVTWVKSRNFFFLRSNIATVVLSDDLLGSPESCCDKNLAKENESAGKNSVLSGWITIIPHQYCWSWKYSRAPLAARFTPEKEVRPTSAFLAPLFREFDQFEKVTFYIFVFDNWKKRRKKKTEN